MKRQQTGFSLGHLGGFSAATGANSRVNPLSGFIRRGRAWAPAAKTAALFLLPIPLVLAALAALIQGDLIRFALSAGALGCFWGAGVLAWRAVVAEARYLLGERPELPSVPFKLLSAAATAAGAAVAATAGGHTPAAALVFAGIGAAGHVAFYGRDLRRPRIHLTAVHGVDCAAVRLQLEQAYGRLRRIESAALSLAVPEFRERLSRIARIGRDVLGEIEQDPRDAARARRFLNLYLESAERVTLEYARTNGRVREPGVPTPKFVAKVPERGARIARRDDRAYREYVREEQRSEPGCPAREFGDERRSRDTSLDQHFRQLLVEMESTFAEQHRRLTDRDLLSLDVDMEVLNARLKTGR